MTNSEPNDGFLGWIVALVERIGLNRKHTQQKEITIVERVPVIHAKGQHRDYGQLPLLPEAVSTDRLDGEPYPELVLVERHPVVPVDWSRLRPIDPDDAKAWDWY